MVIALAIISCYFYRLPVSGSREFPGILMKLLLLMLPRSLFLQNRHLHVLAARKGIVQIKIVIAGKVKGIGKRVGAKHMRGKHYLSFS